jgi:hypothetical protein
MLSKALIESERIYQSQLDSVVKVIDEGRERGREGGREKGEIERKER